MIFAAILAGGKGTRVGAKVPKQFLELGGKPILISTVDKFIESKLCDVIYISVNEMWLEHTKELLHKYYDKATADSIRIVCGGKERIMSFLNIIYDIEKVHGINHDDIVLSHDAVRPFVTTEIIKDCIEKAQVYDVAMATVNSADTTYYSTKEGFLNGTYDRKTLFVGQTPQGCRMDLLHKVISSYPKDELLSMTGTSQLFIRRGIDVKISLGATDNLKITTLEDIDFSEYVMKKAENKNEQ